MLSKQEERTMEPRTSKKMHVKPEVKLKRMLLEKVESAHILDSSGSYHVVLDVFGARDSKLNDVTLVSQTSSYHLNDVVDLCEHWSGPVSISLFTYSVDFEYALRSLIQLYLCYPKIKERVSFHLIFPISHKETVSSFIYNIDCKKINRTSDVINYDIDGIEYPHNLLRNTAIKFSKTKYVFLIDIDMVPNMNLREDFNKYVFDRKHNTNESIVFVVPSFESKVESGIPTDREHLLRLWRLEKLRPFYFDVCWKCQRPLQYDKWKFLPKPENLEIAYLVDWQDPWEPFYIAPRNMPMYDERFKQYGFNRISQVRNYIGTKIFTTARFSL